MRDLIFHLKRGNKGTLQAQLRQMVVAAILDGRLPPGNGLPSCRKLAQTLGVARNTVALAYQDLVEQGFLEARERSGFYVSGDNLQGTVPKEYHGPRHAESEGPEWAARIRLRTAGQRNVVKPSNWQEYQYPFIYGQFDPKLFPLIEWRECNRRALTRRAVNEWASDAFGEDDPLLVEQIRTRLLPRRGVDASPEEILVTVGAQQALCLIAGVLFSDDTRVGIEDPGYPDARNLFSLRTSNIVGIPVDGEGIVVGDQLRGCDYVYATPSHQFPTTVTAPMNRRQELLEAAEVSDVVVIEDDYESEINYLGQPRPALKTLDGGNRVLFVASLSKTLAPGLRCGYIVGPEEFIKEARALRRLMLRHPPTNNQRVIALFLAEGYHDALIRRLSGTFRERWAVLAEALDEHLPQCKRAPTTGGTAFWVEGPGWLDTERLAADAAEQGVLIEPGGIHYLNTDGPRNVFRLGFSSIPVRRIVPGIAILGSLVNAQGEGMPSAVRGNS
jgi:GntR family transcriptional regulator/MocR family aminotransferase